MIYFKSFLCKTWIFHWFIYLYTGSRTISLTDILEEWRGWRPGGVEGLATCHMSQRSGGAGGLEEWRGWRPATCHEEWIFSFRSFSLLERTNSFVFFNCSKTKENNFVNFKNYRSFPIFLTEWPFSKIVFLGKKKCSFFKKFVRKNCSSSKKSFFSKF